MLAHSTSFSFLPESLWIVDGADGNDGADRNMAADAAVIAGETSVRKGEAEASE